jgi:hypothetical protein
MPKDDELYPKKVPHLQFKILALIALKGRLSQKGIAAFLQFKASTISEAFNIMINRTKLINPAQPPDINIQLNVSRRPERFYKLSSQGLLTFIRQDPSPYDFWVAMIWYGFLNFRSAVNRDEFNLYYNLFLQRHIGDYTLRSCFFLGNLFENLFQRWCRELEHKCELDFPDDLVSQMQDVFPHSHDCIMQDGIRKKTEKAYKVLERLLLNRGITINKIIELTRLKEKEVGEIIDEYSMTQAIYSQYVDEYELVHLSTSFENATMSLLDHLLIVRTKKEKEKNNEKYELSLVGVLLVLALISSEGSKRRKDDNVYFNYYNTAASNYREKLLLVFGKWKLLEKTLDDRLYRIFDYLLGNKAEILSLSVSLGGNKEVYDNIKAATMNAINRISIVYDDWIRAIGALHYLEGFRNSAYYQFIQERINEMKISLSFTTLTSFGEYMKEKKESTHISPTFEDDLDRIENALADEFSFLFYVGLLRQNNHVDSDFPFTTAFTRPNPGFVYDKYFLDRIVLADDQIRRRLRKWLKASKTYQDKASKKLEDIYQCYQGLDNDSINNNN